MDSINQTPIIDTTFLDSSNCLPKIKIAYKEFIAQRKTLQNAILRLKAELSSFKQGYVPCEEKIIYRDRTIVQCDSANMFLMESKARAYQDSTLLMTTRWKDQRSTSRNRLWIILALAGVVGLGIFLKIKRII